MKWSYIMLCSNGGAGWIQFHPSKSRLPLDAIHHRPFCRYGGHFDLYCFERHYGILRGQINVHLPPGHSIIAIWNNRNQNGRRICKKVYAKHLATLYGVLHNVSFPTPILWLLSRDKTAMLVPKQYEIVPRVLRNNRVKFTKDFFAIVLSINLAAGHQVQTNNGINVRKLENLVFQILHQTMFPTFIRMSHPNGKS